MTVKAPAAPAANGAAATADDAPKDDGSKAGNQSPQFFGETVATDDNPGPGQRQTDVAGTGEDEIAAPPSPGSDFLAMKWPEGIELPDPVKQYENLGALVEGHVNANKKISEQGKELGSLRKQLKAINEGKTNEALEQVWQQFNADVAANGSASQETIEAITAHVPLDPSILTLFGEFMGQRVASMRDTAAKTFGGDDAAADFFDKLDQSRTIPQHVKDAWHFMAMSGDTSWLPVAAQRLGLKVQQQATPPTSTPTNTTTREITQPAGREPEKVYRTRAEFLKAQGEAIDHFNRTGEKSKEEEVARILSRSPTQSWGE